MAGFDLPAATLAVWAAAGTPPATGAEVAAIADLAADPLPAAYVAFLTTYGFVDFGGVPQNHFASPEGGDALGAMLRAEDIASIRRSPDFDFPCSVLPILDDTSGHGLLLIRTAPPAGAILHSYDGGPPVELAPDLPAFLAGLTALAEPAVRRDTGTPVTDPDTGFTIAAETREAWATYGTGSTPEPADELAEIEATLGRPLPEALRTFLTTYGYVTYFGDAPATFDLPGGGQARLSTIYSTAVLPRALPLEPGAPLPFASTGTDESELLIGMGAETEGVISWRPDPGTAPVRVADDLRGFLARLYREVPDDG